jgi:HD domain
MRIQIRIYFMNRYISPQQLDEKTRIVVTRRPRMVDRRSRASTKCEGTQSPFNSLLFPPHTIARVLSCGKINAMDDRKRPAKQSAGSPSPKRKNSLAKESRFEDIEVPPLVPSGQQAKMIRYNDEIHQSIDLCPLMKRIMDTWPVQRLHDLKQLGTANMVYACATHTRFEHSVGVAHLAREMCRRLQFRHPNFGVTNKDVLCVALAGLLRKFSSVFDVTSALTSNLSFCSIVQ